MVIEGRLSVILDLYITKLQCMKLDNTKFVDVFITCRICSDYQGEKELVIKKN